MKVKEKKGERTRHTDEEDERGNGEGQVEEERKTEGTGQVEGSRGEGRKEGKMYIRPITKR